MPEQVEYAKIELSRRPLDETDILPEDDRTWQADGLCTQTDPEVFFPEKGGSTRMAKKVCEMCIVRENCLDYALRTDQNFGIWGGVGPRDRAKLKKKQA